jgi:hypothetical protein
VLRDINASARPSIDGGAAHVLFHLEHPFARLEIESAGVEAHAFADERDLGRASSPQRKSMSRGSRALARPTMWIVG